MWVADVSSVVHEVPFKDFDKQGKDGRAPVHQIVHIKCDGRIVWDYNTPFTGKS